MEGARFLSGLRGHEHVSLVMRIYENFLSGLRGHERGIPTGVHFRLGIKKGRLIATL